MSYKGRISTGRTLRDSLSVMTTGGVVDAVALGPVVSGLIAEVAIEDGSDLGLLAGGVVSESSSSTPSLLLDPPKAASNMYHSFGTGAPTMAVVKLL